LAWRLWKNGGAARAGRHLTTPTPIRLFFRLLWHRRPGLAFAPGDNLFSASRLAIDPDDGSIKGIQTTAPRRLGIMTGVTRAGFFVNYKENWFKTGCRGLPLTRNGIFSMF